MSFPSTRMRRLRRSETLRGLVRETELSPAHLIQPAFVVAGEGVREEVESMPGIERFSISELVAEATEIASAGIGAILLFGVPAAKDETGSGAYDDEGVGQIAVRALKEGHPELTVITDVCLCEDTSRGHCGLVLKGDVGGGAALLMGKPAVPYLDVGRRVKEETCAPGGAYHVSGGCWRLKAAAANGWIDERSAVLETLVSIRRAGADAIVTYYAKE